MNSKKVGYSRMYMVTPSIWELVKKCVNEHEQKLLDNLNKDTSEIRQHSTSSIIHNISSKDVTPLEPDVTIPPNQPSRHDEIDLDHSKTSYHRSKDRSRSFLDPNISYSSNRHSTLPDDSFNQSRPSSHRLNDESRISLNPNLSRSIDRSRLNPSQISLPEDSFSEESNPPLNISQHSNKSKINISQPTFQHTNSFGNLPPPENLTTSQYIQDPGEYSFFKPKRTSSPIDRGAIIPILPLPSCEKRLPRSPIKTRTKTGALKQHTVKIPRNDKFICEYCNKHFARKWNLKKHIQTIHKQKILPDPDQPALRTLKRKAQTSFTQPLLKSRKLGNFDQWNLSRN